MRFPYERIVQWSAGPVSILAGWLAVQIVSHVKPLGSLGLGQDQIAHAIVVAVTFGVGSLVTYAAHHKWLTNLTSWWMQTAIQEAPKPAAPAGERAVAKEPQSAPAPVAMPEVPADLLPDPGTQMPPPPEPTPTATPGPAPAPQPAPQLAPTPPAV